MGSKANLLRTLAKHGEPSVVGGVPSFGLDWRPTSDEGGQYVYSIAL